MGSVEYWLEENGAGKFSDHSHFVEWLFKDAVSSTIKQSLLRQSLATIDSARFDCLRLVNRNIYRLIVTCCVNGREYKVYSDLSYSPCSKFEVGKLPHLLAWFKYKASKLVQEDDPCDEWPAGAHGFS